MDSFEWFGEIGNQLYDSLKPPGDRHREIFNTATMGLESFGGGGGAPERDGPDWDESADLQHEANMNNWNDGWAAQQRNYNQSKLINTISRRNEEVAARWKDASALRQWEYQTKMQEAQYNAQVQAYNKAERLYEAQVGYNRKAAEMAYEQEAAVTKERYFKLAYQGAEQELAANMKRYEGDLRLQSARRESAFKSQDLMVKQIQGEGKVRGRGRVGRSADKQYQSLVAEAGRATAQLKAELTSNNEQYNLAVEGIEANRTLQQQQRAQAKLSIGEAYQRATKKIQLDEYGANLQADAQRMFKPSPPIPIPAPLETPRSIIADPMMPVRGSKPVWGAGMGQGMLQDSGGQMSGGQMAASALGTAGSVAMAIPGGQLAGGIMMGASMIAGALF